MAKRAAGLLPFYAAASLLAFGLKLHYSHAGADELRWILEPACRLAAALGGLQFEREAGAGWVDHEHRLIVGPGCAGLNFLVAAFIILFVPLVHRLGRAAARLAHIAASLAAAWLLTVVVNATRILGAVHLNAMEIYSPLVTPERVHRAEGAILFCLSLLLAYLGAERVIERCAISGGSRRRPAPLVPLYWYPCLALGVPLLNGAAGREAGRFLEHAALLVTVCVALALVLLGLGRLRRRFTPDAAGTEGMPEP